MMSVQRLIMVVNMNVSILMEHTCVYVTGDTDLSQMGETAVVRMHTLLLHS